jgi:hypothetical protein
MARADDAIERPAAIARTAGRKILVFMGWSPEKRIVLKAGAAVRRSSPRERAKVMPMRLKRQPVPAFQSRKL